MAEPDEFQDPTEYQLMAERLRRIIQAVRNGEGGEVSLLALFGSVARLTATIESDADVLALYAGAPDWYAAYQQATPLVRLIRQIEERMADRQPNWPICVLSGTRDASDLDEEFLTNIAADGVLLYHEPGTPIPLPVAHLRPFEGWVREIEHAMSGEGQAG